MRGARHPWGLHDLHGNVREWCVDPGIARYTDREFGITYDSTNLILNNDPTPPRVFRGGCWAWDPLLSRSASRVYGRPAVRNDSQGFRLLRPLPESP